MRTLPRRCRRVARRPAPDPIAVAEHWERAGDAPRAVSWLATAAEAAWDASDLDTGRRMIARGYALGATGVDRGRQKQPRVSRSLRGRVPRVAGARAAGCGVVRVGRGREAILTQGGRAGEWPSIGRDRFTVNEPGLIDRRDPFAANEVTVTGWPRGVRRGHDTAIEQPHQHFSAIENGSPTAASS